MEEVYFKDSSPLHHLIFCPWLDDGEIDVVPSCSVCYASIMDRPVYKCLECNFHQHMDCTFERPYKRKGERIVSNLAAHNFANSRYHHLIKKDVENTGNEEVVVCAAGCEEPEFGRTAYKCSLPNCTFLLHNWCRDLPHLITQHPMHPEHTLFLQDKVAVLFQNKATFQNNATVLFQNKATVLSTALSTLYCDACGKVCEESLFYGCSLGEFIVHIKCASRRRINADDCHQHEFVSSRTQIQFTCQACGEERKDIACICSICRLLIHRKCTQVQPTIKTLKHEHPLTRTYSLRQVKKQQDKAFCKLCGKEVNIEYAAYYCQTCDHHIVHLICAYTVLDKYSMDCIKSNIKLPASYSDDCRAHLVHLVEGIKPVEDPGEIQHSLSDKKPMVDHKRCDACMQFIIFDASVCRYDQSNFLCHNRCTKLPKTVTRRLFYTYPLTLISNYSVTNRLFWCRLCKRNRSGFSYKCASPASFYDCDVQCCLIPEVLDHEGHPHPLHMCIQRYDEACNACGENVEDVVKFKCNDSSHKFTLCIRCATLPLVARYEHDAHLLQLASTCDYDFKEYYCLICEEERQTDYWFYYCKKCKFTAHPKCVIGKNPGIEYGRTYYDQFHRQHPVTIVEKTEPLPPCDACGNPFEDGVALQCTQCKFNVHQQYKDHHCYYKNECLNDKYRVKK